MVTPGATCRNHHFVSHIFQVADWAPGTYIMVLFVFKSQNAGSNNIQIIQVGYGQFTKHRNYFDGPWLVRAGSTHWILQDV